MVVEAITMYVGWRDLWFESYAQTHSLKAIASAHYQENKKQELRSQMLLRLTGPMKVPGKPKVPRISGIPGSGWPRVGQ